MTKTNNRIQVILSEAALPLMAHYNAEKGFAEAIVSRLVCDDCKTEVVANKTAYPLCPCCSQPKVMKVKADAQNVTITSEEFKDLHVLGSCEGCATNYVSNEETISALADHSFHCLVCSDPVQVSDNGDDDKTKTSSTDDTKPATDTGESKADNEAEKELNEVLKKMDLVDEDGKPKTPEKKTEKEGENKTDVTSGDDDDEENSDNDDKDNDNKDDDDDSDSETTAALAVYKTALKKGKKFSLIASDGFENWYLFVDKSPLAIASYSDADPSVQRIFRSHDYVEAFETAVKSDGGVSKKLTEDFGFEPIKVNVDFDDVTKQLVDDEVEKKTKDLDEKIKSLSEVFDQCVGIAAAGTAKGVYPKADGFRNKLVAKLTTIKVRDPEELVDSYLTKELPNLMRDVLLQAQDLMNKNSTESLETLASTVEEMAPRALPKTKQNVVPFMVTSETASVGKNEGKDNLGKEAHKPIKTTGVMSGLKTRC